LNAFPTRCIVRAKHSAQFLDEKIVAQVGAGGRNMSDPQFLKKVSLFAEFDGEELQVLGETVKSTRYFPGDSVLEEGSANRALHRRLASYR
jgi:hypothetical protein